MKYFAQKMRHPKEFPFFSAPKFLEQKTAIATEISRDKRPKKGWKYLETYFQTLIDDLLRFRARHPTAKMFFEDLAMRFTMTELKGWSECMPASN